MPTQPTPDSLRRQAAQLKRDAEREAKELEAMADDLERALSRAQRRLDLSSATNHATIRRMESTESLQSAPIRKRRGPKSSGKVTDLVVELGLASMAELAKALGEKPANLRSWNKRGSIPEAARPAIDRLRDKQRKA